MRHLLARAQADVLAQLAWADLLVALDFDGALSGAAPDDERAGLRRATRELLAAVTARYPCAVISGRPRDELARRLEGAGVQQVIGCYGLDGPVPGEAFGVGVRALRELLARRLDGVQGVELEDKRFSVAVHYRRSRAALEARAAIEAAVAALPGGCRVIAGRRVVNVLPAGAPHKGLALAAARAAAGSDVVLYVGGDPTDEDVFESERPGRLVGVRVGRSAGSAASYFLHDRREVDALLGALAALREPGAAEARAREGR